MFQEIADGSWIIHESSHFNKLKFNDLWKLKPDEKEKINMFGKIIEPPRFSKTYLTDYNFSGKNHVSEKKIPQELEKIHNFFQFFNKKFNGILVNWYEPDGYIGFHSDDEKKLIQGEPILTLTLLENKDEPRKFVLKSKTSDDKSEFFLNHGDIFIMGGDCQKTHKHSVPKSSKYKFKRISITIRAFE